MTVNSTVRLITKSLIAEMEPNSIIWDTNLTGFGVRRQKGKPSYIIKCRVNGKQVHYTIGQHGAFTPDLARKEARTLLANAQKGIDPREAKRAARDLISVEGACQHFLNTHVAKKRKPKTLQEYRRIIEKIVTPKIGKLKIKEVTAEQISKLHHGLSDTPYQANRTLAILSTIFNLAETMQHRPQGTNPCKALEKYPEVKKDRYLTADELKRLAAILNRSCPITDLQITEPNGGDLRALYSAAAIWLLLFTGARLNEILTLKWSDLSNDHTSARLADSKTGAKTIQLSASAQTVLKQIPKVEGNPYIIVGKKKNSCLVNLQKPWDKIRQDAGIPDVRLHDLRHTYASYGAMNGTSLPILGKILGHQQTSTTDRYAHFDANPIASANEEISSQIMGIISDNNS